MTDARAGHSLWTGPRGDHRRYRVDLRDGALQSVGDGGEGLVYRAVRESDGLEVALKMLTALTLDDYPRIEQRGRLMAEIDHSNVMHQIETFTGTALVDIDNPRDEDFDIIYTVADWIPGVPLGVGIEAAGPVAGLRWVAQIARAVASLHAFRAPEAPNGVIHRDIKPSNVRIFQDRAVLIDFGIARAHDTSDLTQGAGTYQWRAPEVLGGPGSPGPASDVWGVGALAYWVLLNEPPRLEGTAAARERLLPAARDAGIHDPASTAGHVAGLLETDPDDRPTDLNRWADELDPLLAGARRRPNRKKAARRYEGRKTRRRVVVAVGLVLLVIGGLGVFAFVAQNDSGTNQRGLSPFATTARQRTTTSATPTSAAPGLVRPVAQGIDPLAVHESPQTDAASIGDGIPAGASVSIDCWKKGDSVTRDGYAPDDLWDHVTYGSLHGYATAAFIDGNDSDVTSQLPECTD